MNQSPVYVFAKWQVKEGQLEHVLPILAKAVKESIQEEGNLFYKVHQSDSEANTLVLSEAYINDAALEAHRNTTHFKTLVVEQIVPNLAHREVIVTSQLNLDEYIAQ